QSVCSRGQNPAHIRDIGVHAAQAFKLAAGLACDDLCERSFSGSRRTEKNQRLNAIRFNRATQEISWTENMSLANVFVERTRTQPGREGLMPPGFNFRRNIGFRSGRRRKQIISRRGGKLTAPRTIA